MSKIRKTLSRIWNDPVWSKVIAGGIISLVLVIYGIIATYVSVLPFSNIAQNISNFIKYKVAIPIWLIFLFIISLLTNIFFYFNIVKEKFFNKSEILTEYFTIAEIAEDLSVSEQEIYKWAFSGKLILSFIRDIPSNFEDVRVEKDEKGKEITIRREVNTVFSFSSKEKPPLNLVYIKPEDSVRVIRNQKENRSIFVHELYETNELLAKKSVRVLNNSISLKREDLVVTAIELNRFKTEYKKELQNL